jgi:hypothetical protein
MSNQQASMSSDPGDRDRSRVPDAASADAAAGPAGGGAAAAVVAPRSLRTSLLVWAILFCGFGCFAWAAAHAAHRVHRSAPAAETAAP